MTGRIALAAQTFDEHVKRVGIRRSGASWVLAFGTRNRCFGQSAEKDAGKRRHRLICNKPRIHGSLQRERHLPTEMALIDFPPSRPPKNRGPVLQNDPRDSRFCAGREIGAGADIHGDQRVGCIARSGPDQTPNLRATLFKNSFEQRFLAGKIMEHGALGDTGHRCNRIDRGLRITMFAEQPRGRFKNDGVSRFSSFGLAYHRLGLSAGLMLANLHFDRRSANIDRWSISCCRTAP
jgi:hypothetical protein